ncbi:MAG: aspartate-semialdehyde dehydrogenase [Chloroflexi bacterium]|nr:aspartate-semialdehyde dehydrogenase [Chloroflexota bacterium]MCL5273659.1 aspartate-semialdehyde dehydrogenase [Chloroflexota bacterium]
MANKIPVVVLGATGAVGQRFIQLLQNHPVFEIAALTASDRSEGKRYADAVHWVIEGDAPVAVQDMVLLPTHASIVGARANVRVAFSALPNDSAQTAEPAFAQAGVTVFSNASFYRMAKDVPLVITEVNSAHLRLLKRQRAARGWSGGIVCNTNCTVSGPAMSLRPLYDAFGVKRVFAVSMQAESGAGYPGVPSLDITDNVLPFIRGEEDKMEAEARKLLGALRDDHIDDAPFGLSAHCNRVQVTDGHMVTMSVELSSPAKPEEVIRVLNDFHCADVDGLHMAPDRPVVVRDEPDRPQPRRDRMTGKGMSTVVGRVRAEPLFGDCGVKFMTLSHNTIRGAAGGSLLNAELCARWGLI